MVPLFVLTQNGYQGVLHRSTGTLERQCTNYRHLKLFRTPCHPSRCNLSASPMALISATQHVCSYTRKNNKNMSLTFA